jgi:UDP-galactose transporter B1
MIFGTILGKRYSWQKYLNIAIITSGVALFVGGGNSSSKADAGSGAMFYGVIILFISLCFDGATGAYEDKLMGTEHVGPFDLMYNIQLGKAVISFCALIAVNQLDDLQQTLQSGGFFLLVLGFTGAIGQVFVFLTISKFGALNCALIGLGRKILSLVLSFLAFGHVLNIWQSIGLMLALLAMIFHFLERVSSLHYACVLLLH